MKKLLHLFLFILCVNSYSQNYFIPQYNASNETSSDPNKKLIKKIDTLTASINIENTNNIKDFILTKKLNFPNLNTLTLSQIRDYKFADSDTNTNAQDRKELEIMS